MFSIGQLAKQLNCAVQTIRYYESIGLVAPPQRTEGNQRRYNHTHLNQLKFVRHARELGFSLEDIQALLRLSKHAEESCDQADAIAKQQLQAVRSRLARLRALEDELARMISACRGGTVENCRVIEVLENHALCLHDHAGNESVLGDQTKRKPVRDRG